jgi:bacteriocin-like protein
MTNPRRELTTEELRQVSGGFNEVEHAQMTALQTATQQLSFMMNAANSVIKGIRAR